MRDAYYRQLWREQSRKRSNKARKRINLDALYERDNGMCWICLARGVFPGVSRQDASRDHLVPISQGGDDSYDNVRLAHKRCNNARGDRTIEAILEYGLFPERAS